MITGLNLLMTGDLGTKKGPPLRGGPFGNSRLNVQPNLVNLKCCTVDSARCIEPAASRIEAGTGLLEPEGTGQIAVGNHPKHFRASGRFGLAEEVRFALFETYRGCTLLERVLNRCDIREIREGPVLNQLSQKLHNTQRIARPDIKQESHEYQHVEVGSGIPRDGTAYG